MESSAKVPYYTDQLLANFSILFTILAVMTLLRLLDAFVFGGKINRNYSLVSRAKFRPITFFTWSILHGSRDHLLGNSIPFLILGFLTMLPSVRDFYITTAITTVFTGFLAWRFGPPRAGNVGASGLIYGYFGFLLSRGFFAKDSGAVLLALAVFLIPQTLLYQLFPNQSGITRTGHFFGFVSGIISAWVVSLLPSV
jgi:membrane associated rhomboid family serine protease